MTVSCKELRTRTSFSPQTATGWRRSTVYGLLDTPPDEGFDRIAGAGAEICGTPMALVSLIDADRQWFKARIGVALREAPACVVAVPARVARTKSFGSSRQLLDGRFATNRWSPASRASVFMRGGAARRRRPEASAPCVCSTPRRVAAFAHAAGGLTPWPAGHRAEWICVRGAPRWPTPRPRWASHAEGPGPSRRTSPWNRSYELAVERRRRAPLWFPCRRGQGAAAQLGPGHRE